MADTHEQTTLDGGTVQVENDPLPIGESLPYLGRARPVQTGLPLSYSDTLELEV